MEVQHSTQRTQQILDLARSGMTGAEIGRQFGVSRERIRQIVKGAGLDTRQIVSANRDAAMKTAREARRRQRKAAAIARFWRRIDKRGPAECWEYQGCRFPTGYGNVGNNSSLGNMYAHRAAFALANGYQPTRYVMHTCDNPPCCNPAHLREGSPMENVRDAMLKGRRPIAAKHRTEFLRNNALTKARAAQQETALAA